MASEAGKGSKPRPFSINQQEYDQRWDAIFGKDLKKEEVQRETKEQTETKKE